MNCSRFLTFRHFVLIGLFAVFFLSSGSPALTSERTATNTDGRKSIRPLVPLPRDPGLKPLPSPKPLRINPSPICTEAQGYNLSYYQNEWYWNHNYRSWDRWMSFDDRGKYKPGYCVHQLPGPFVTFIQNNTTYYLCEGVCWIYDTRSQIYCVVEGPEAFVSPPHGSSQILDQVILKDGRVLTGRYLGGTKEVIRMEVNGTVIEIDRKDALTLNLASLPKTLD